MRARIVTPPNIINSFLILLLNGVTLCPTNATGVTTRQSSYYDTQNPLHALKLALFTYKMNNDLMLKEHVYH